MSTKQTTEATCRVCDLPEEGHNTRYTAGVGEHEYYPPRDSRPVYERTSDRVEREWTPEMGHPLPPVQDGDHRFCTATDPCIYCEPDTPGARLPFGHRKA
jgi:hypothetical protein